MVFSETLYFCCVATDASVTCGFQTNYICGYNHVRAGSQLTHWSAVAGPAGVNEGPTVGTTTGRLSGVIFDLPV